MSANIGADLDISGGREMGNEKSVITNSEILTFQSAVHKFSTIQMGRIELH